MQMIVYIKAELMQPYQGTPGVLHSNPSTGSHDVSTNNKKAKPRCYCITTADDAPSITFVLPEAVTAVSEGFHLGAGCTVL